MRFTVNIIALCLAVAGAKSEEVEDKCPKGEIACLDVINNSFCIEGIALNNPMDATKEELVKCVEYDGMSSKLPGATKYCRCPGCHSAPINAVIERLFPAPCS
ncbi:hypothetical protein BJ875DRAFT_480750 [Amylocarpus encephaloides]|uniref:Uncharacterized protein n=1 Tax=Amylocarpus encephaloides TaxID=45428 RepID=A0A9P7YR01_9HELO|nr:hypothetical protein BJ875DRAFT_480750 [Amylocarpus encephaloides]